MSESLTSHLAQLEQQRVEALLTVDTAVFDALHDPAYQLCNPTGTVWDKAEYRRRLTTGELAYSRLETTSEIDVLASETLAVLRYRCLIALSVDGTDIPAHECWHSDTYIRAEDGQWRCRYSQATGIMDPAIPAAAG
ncbi:nuclear transport factor 2 family protein [Amycolatopsis roodepoortensis]|uniref:nuclear transport factor 2 family protein n=1 Tax=Amycolatopsis roodepoortensis TaxID=700274 RepID=UPI00214C9E80|nr:nuclear transport factor 2 family protein [Amycolatopsis roodepoortensis]UUV32572.1 nuclear transport factor 2 family protein [Amycolatopsis roodepoortensis]